MKLRQAKKILKNLAKGMSKVYKEDTLVKAICRVNKANLKKFA